MKLTENRGYLCVAAWVVVFSWCAVGTVQAVDLPPGGATALSGVPGGAGPGSIVYDHSTPFEVYSGGGALMYAGRLQNRVVRLDDTGTLAFILRIRDTQPSLNGAVAYVLTSDFTGFLTDVEYSTTGLGTVAPTRAERSASGQAIRYIFGDQQVWAGAESRFMHAATEAIDFGDGGTTRIMINTGDYVDIPTMMPIRPVEPGCREIDFEDLPLNMQVPCGGSMSSNGVLMNLHEFYWDIGSCTNPTCGGSVRVYDDGDACRSGHELWLNNVNVEFDYGVTVQAMRIHYGEFGGNVNLIVNGDCHSVPNFADLPSSIGGVNVMVVDAGTPGQGCGHITLEGSIDSVSIGGQEFVIDDVYCEVDPCIEDVDAPVAELVQPPAMTCVCQPVEVIGTADDANFDHYELRVRPAGGSAWEMIEVSNTPVVNGLLGTWTSATAAQGYYVIELTAWDVCRQSTTVSQVIWLGTTFDTLDVREPDNGQVYGRTVCFDGTVWDNFCFDSYTVEYKANAGGTWYPVEPGTPVYTSSVINDPFAHWDTVALGLADGGYRLRINAQDRCGNSAQEFREVIVDNTAPEAEIVGPDPCECVEGVVGVRGTAVDDNLSSWVLQYTGGDASNWVTINSGTGPVANGLLGVWDTTLLRPCAYTLRLVVWDAAKLDCNSSNRHRSEYTVSINVGPCHDFDADNDGDIDLDDFRVFENEFTGPLP